MKYVRIFTVNPLEATINNGYRFTIRDYRYGGRVILSRQHKYDSSVIQAIAYLESIGIRIDSRGEYKDGWILTTTNFDTQLK